MSVDDRHLREVGSSVIDHAQDQQRAVVVRSESAATVFIGGVENKIADFTGGVLRRNGLEKSFEALRTELLLLVVFGFENSIRSEQNGIAGLKIQSQFVVLRVRKEAERNTRHTNLLHFAIANEQRIRSTGIRKSEASRTGVVDGEGHGDKAPIQPRTVQPPIQHRQHFRWRTRVLGHMLANGADGQGAKQRGGCAFSGNVAERDSEAAFAVGKKIVEIAAEVARRTVAGGQIEAGNLTRSAGK